MLRSFVITYADLGLGIRARGRLPQDVFHAPLDAIEAALPEELRKPAVNQWLGSLMCPPYKYRVFTVQAPHASVPFAGPRLPKRRRAGSGTCFAGSARSR